MRKTQLYPKVIFFRSMPICLLACWLCSAGWYFGLFGIFEVGLLPFVYTLNVSEGMDILVRFRLNLPLLLNVLP